jgi:hypothetical protein
MLDIIADLPDILSVNDLPYRNVLFNRFAVYNT